MTTMGAPGLCRCRRRTAWRLFASPSWVTVQVLTTQRSAGRAPALGEDAPESKAQALVFQAHEEEDPERRVRLALDALAAWPDCADAYVVLAEHAPSRKESVALYEKGVAAGERAVGPEAFR